MIAIGRVLLNVDKNSQQTISSITVKMEGISETRLLIPNDREHETSRSKKAEIEIHKVHT